MAHERRREETRREPLRGLFDPTGHRLSFGLLQLREARDDPFAGRTTRFLQPDTCVKGNGSKHGDRSSFVKPRRPQDPTASGDGRCRPLCQRVCGLVGSPSNFLPPQALSRFQTRDALPTHVHRSHLSCANSPGPSTMHHPRYALHRTLSRNHAVLRVRRVAQPRPPRCRPRFRATGPWDLRD